MNYSNTRSAASHYKQVSLQSEVAHASPHRLIQMLMEGALQKIAMAKMFMENGQVAEKGTHIGWAISIIDGLRLSLDKEAGGEIAANLDNLYDYMERQLVKANIDNQAALLDEVSGLLLQIKSAWDGLPEEYKNNANAGEKQAEQQALANAD